MEIVNGTTFFDKTNQTIKQYKYLDKNIKCDILIIGGGIEGCILNYYLSKRYNVVLVDAKRISRCSTCIATALLEFQLDKFANDLSKYLSKEEIISIYRMGLKSIDSIEKFIKKYGNHCNFSKKSSFLYSNESKDINKIKDEFIFRIQNNFNCIFYDKKTNPFCFDIKAGILDKNGGAEFNPYLFAKQMIENSSNQDNIYENTKIIKIEQNCKEIECYTEYGNIIKANKIILATGFNTELISERVKNLLSMQVSYSIVTNQIFDIPLYNNVLIQDCLINYHYLRTLPDNRIIFGGEDTKYNGKIDKELSKRKYNSLLKNLQKMFKNCKNIDKNYEFCGIFATTDNNLGIIGESENKNILYFLSCGANGIINSFCGVNIILDILKGKENKFSKLFSPLR